MLFILLVFIDNMFLNQTYKFFAQINFTKYADVVLKGKFIIINNLRDIKTFILINNLRKMMKLLFAIFSTTIRDNGNNWLGLEDGRRENTLK